MPKPTPRLLSGARDRLEALRSLKILDAPPEPDFDRLVKLAARLFDVPVAGVGIADAERQWIKASVGTPVTDVRLEGSFCEAALRSGEPLVVSDARRDARFSGHPMVMAYGMGFYAGQLLRDAHGVPIGTFFLADAAPRDFSAEDLAALGDFAHLASLVIQRTYGQRRQEFALERQTELLQLLEVTAVAANEAPTVEAAIRRILAHICALTGWPVGHFWWVQPTDEGPDAVPTGCWHFEAPERDVSLRVHSALTAHHDEAHLVQQVLATGQAAYLALDPDEWPDAPSVARSGLKGGLACPVVAGEGLSGVMTFFVTDDAQPDPALLDVLFHVGAQLGQVVERAHAERRVRESEDRYRRLVEMAPDAVLLHRRSRIVYANSAAARMFGARHPDDLVDLSVYDLVQEGDREQLRQRYSQGPSSEGASGTLHQLLRLDGSVFDAEVRTQALGLAGEAASLAIIRDVTERRRGERLQGEFISIVSHELRTPINTLMGALDLLGSRMLGEFPPQAHRMIDIAMNNTMRLKRLVNDMLDIQLLEWGQLPLYLAAADASDLLLQARDAMQPLAVQREVALEVTPLLAPVTVDVDRMAQVFANLVGNALKYTPAGGRVSLGAAVVGREVVFEVRDDGRGIPGDQLATIFEKFQQVAPGEARERGGAGLGLAIARGLVERHGGRIWAESTLGAGSRFFVALPLADDEAAAP